MSVVLELATIWLAALIAGQLVLVLVLRDTLARVLAADTMAVQFAALLALLAQRANSPYPLDTAMVIVLLGFLGTLAAVRASRRAAP